MKSLRVLLLLVGLLYFVPPRSHAETDFVARTEQDIYGTWLVFPSKEWSAYVVEQSNDLTTWTPAENGSYYGDGTDLRYFILDPPPPPPVTQGAGSAPPQNLPPYESYSVSGALFPPPHDNKILLQGTFPTMWTAIAPISYPPTSIWSFTFLNLPDRRISMDLWFHHSPWNASYADLSPDLLNPAQRKAFDTVMMMYPQSITGLIQTGTYTMPETTPDPNSRRFFRVIETPADSDGDGVTDELEDFLGSSQWLVDSDGDGIPDGTEVDDGSDPADPDSDDDGFLDNEDTNNDDPEDHPPPVTYLLVATKSVSFGPGSGGVEYGYQIDRSNNWTNFVASAGLPMPFTSAAAMVGEFGTPAFPNNLDVTNLKGEQWSSDSTISTLGKFENVKGATPVDLKWYQGNINATRCWLVHKPIEETDVTATFLLTEKKTGTAGSPPTVPDPQVVKLTVEAGKTISTLRDIIPDFSGIPTALESYTITAEKTLAAIKIGSGENTAGVVGDFIPSSKKTGGSSHFVTPLAHPGLPNTHASFKAEGIEKNQITEGDSKQLFSWNYEATDEKDQSTTWTVEIDPADPRIVKIPRTKTGKLKLELVPVAGGDKITLMFWVVSADSEIDHVPPVVVSGPIGDTTEDGTVCQAHKIELTTRRTIFTISPKSLFTAEGTDRPALHGTRNPEVALPGETEVDPFGKGSLKDGSKLKWDASRRMEIVIENPNQIPKAKLSGGTGVIYDGQPKASAPPAVPFPTDQLVGNDDPDTGDEEDNPYSISGGNWASNHLKGQMAIADAPKIFIPDAGAAVGAKWTETDTWVDFVRVELGSKWYWIPSGKEGQPETKWRIVLDVEMIDKAGGGKIWKPTEKTKYSPTLP